MPSQREVRIREELNRITQNTYSNEPRRHRRVSSQEERKHSSNTESVKTLSFKESTNNSESNIINHTEDLSKDFA